MWVDFKKMLMCALFFISTYLVFFTHDSLLNSIRVSISLLFLFILPGYFILYNKKFEERIIFGTLISASIIGITSYYMGLAGVHIRYHWVIALALIIIGIVLEVKTCQKK